jgi:HPt (histidine-containing phosphotransfer) domain-containing protein
MPEMDGLEATRAIWREWPGEQRPRIVAMTANAMQEDREECLAAGMDDFVSKPICVDELVRALAACQPLTETARPIICAPMTNRSAATPAPSTAVPDVAALNPAALDRLREMGGGDEMFVAELIGIFLADAPRMLAEMRRALELGDATTLRRVAHSLKSNSRDFGAEALAQVCLTMETLGKEGKLDGAMDKLTEAETEYGRVANALHRLRRA